MKQFFISAYFLISTITAFTQTTGDYRSNPTSGNNWGTAANWQRFDGASWVAAVAAPTSADGAIEIRSGHNIIVAANVTADQITVNGTLTVNSGITLTAGAAASMLTVNSGGVVSNNSGTIGGTSTSNNFNAGSLYIHDSNNSNGGIVPTATWNSSSTVRMAFSDNRSYTLTSTSWSQQFGNLEVNITSTGNRTNSFAGLIQNIAGNFIILNNASNSNSTLILASAGTNTITVGGNFVFSQNTNINLASTAGASTTIRVAGNFSHTGGGTILTTGTGNVIFNGSGTPQIYTRTGTISGAVNFTIASGAVVDFGTTPITQIATPGTGTFTLNGEMRLGIATGLNGILVNTGTKTFNANSTITYNGTVAQVMGTLYPASPASNITVVVNKSSGALTTSLATTIVTGELRLTNGTLNVSTANHTLTLNGPVTRTSGSLTINAAGNLIVGGSGALVNPFPFLTDQTFSNFTLNRTGEVFALGNNVTLTGTSTLTEGIISLGSSLLTLSGVVTITNGLVSGTSSSSLTIDGAGVVNTINFQTGGNVLGTLSVNRNGEVISFGGNYTIAQSLNVTGGTLNGGTNVITMQGTTWSVDGLSGGVFSPGSSTVIFDGTTDVIYATDFFNLQLNASRTLSFPADVITIGGNVTMDASSTFVHNGGTVTYNGSAAQTVSAGGQNFNNVIVNKTGGSVDLTSGKDLEGVLDIISATTVNADGNLTLISTNDDPDETGSIGPLLGGADVQGDVNSQRLISAEGRFYRYISSPIAGTTIADWQNDFIITGTFTGASTVDPVTGLTTVCGTTIRPTSPSLYEYLEATGGTVQNGWTAYPTSNTSAPIVMGVGYAAFIRETCYRDVVISATGEINKGTLSLPVSFTNSGSADDGWNLVGNPYPSAITWDVNANGWSNVNLLTSVDVRDNVTGNFVTLLAGDVISQGQAFWVKATAAGPSLQISEEAKSGQGISFYKQSADRDLLSINLSKGSSTDKTYVRVVDGASIDVDVNDFPNQNNEFYEVATLIGGQQMSVNSVPSIACGDLINVHVKDMTNGSYIFSIETEGIFKNLDILLKDNFTGVTTNLSTAAYSFEVNSTIASKASNRFEILLSQPSIDTEVVINTGTGNLCGEEGYLISITEPQDGVSYFAVLNDVGISDSVSSEIFIPSSFLETGLNEIMIKGKNYCSESSLQIITVNKVPLVEAYSPTVSLCGIGSALLNASSTGAVDYRWYDQNGFEVGFGASYQTPELLTSTSYYVSALNNIGCEGPKTKVDVTVNQFDPVTITLVGRNRLRSSYSMGNQWYFNGQQINGATSQFYVATESGEYSVEATISGCKTTATIQHRQVRANDNQPVMVYPNPFNSTVGLSIEVVGDKLGSVQLYSASGAYLTDIPMTSVVSSVWVNSIELNSLPKGLYYVKVFVDNKMITNKVLKND